MYLVVNMPYLASLITNKLLFITLVAIKEL